MIQIANLFFMCFTNKKGDVSMQINNINQSYNNTNFQAIKSVKCRGLYEKYPELGQQLVDAFQKCKEAMDFCKKYDSDIVFYAKKDGIDTVESSIHIFYDNPALSKLKKFFKFLNSSEDRVEVSAWGYDYDLTKSLQGATDSLKKRMMPWDKSTNPSGGLLNSHIESTNLDIQTALAQKIEKVEKKKAKAEASKNIKSEFENNKAKLDSSIQDLIEKGQ